MSKTAFIFPGQGAQYVGMAKDIYDNSVKARELIEQAEDKIKFSLSKVMFEGPLEELKLTSNTQPAIFLHSILLLNEINDFNIDAVAGHSLGEYSALVANKTLLPLDALALVRKRGEAMLEAGKKYPGTMAAVIGLKDESLIEVCNKASAKGIVQCANFNSPGQIVISGSIEGVKEAMVLAKESGAKIVKELVVSGAFHSPLMKPAIEELKESLDNTKFNNPTCPVYTNVKALPTEDVNEIKKLLLEQLTAPVKWEKSMEQMIEDGVTEFVEIGPGKVLQGLAKRINKNVSVKNLEKFEDIEKIF
ncbi:MAG: [acyl-carrier-protein] S-malonyltransferase [Ignavibacteriae bacterium]|nr:MAG: [acyl-carrier-protein] S-malonyltransferase [Ignavibacteriota bacterium]